MKTPLAFWTGKLKGGGGVFKSPNLNLFAYAQQNPVKYIDPDGKAILKAIIDVAKHPTTARIATAAVRGISRAYRWGVDKIFGKNFVDPKFAQQLKKQFAKDGSKSIKKSLSTLKKRLSEHTKKLKGLKYKSSVKREIRTFKKQIKTIKQFIKRNKIK